MQGIWWGSLCAPFSSYAPGGGGFLRHVSCGYSSGRSGLGATAANSPCRDGWMRDESMVLRGPARVWVTCARASTPHAVVRCGAVCSGGNPRAHLLGEGGADERHESEGETDERGATNGQQLAVEHSAASRAWGETHVTHPVLNSFRSPPPRTLPRPSPITRLRLISYHTHDHTVRP